jgi:hypothetical protein
VTKSPPAEITRFGKIMTGATILLAILLAIVLIHPFFADWIYLKFILICGLGMANLGILYLIKC